LSRPRRVASRVPDVSQIVPGQGPSASVQVPDCRIAFEAAEVPVRDVFWARLETGLWSRCPSPGLGSAVRPPPGTQPQRPCLPRLVHGQRNAPTRWQLPRRVRRRRARGARRGGLDRGLDRSPRRGRDVRPDDPAATPIGKSRSARADDEIGPERRARSTPLPRPPRRPRARCRADPRRRHNNASSPPGSAAAVKSTRLVSTGSGSSRRRKPSSMRLASGIVSVSPNPNANSAGESPRGSSSNAKGLPRVSATIRSRTC
jgi:hypothetical protein